ADGNAVVVWEQTNDSVSWSVGATTYSVGSGWGAGTLIETHNTGSSIAPQIAMDANGNAIAAWNRQESSDLWVNRYTVGSGWGAATLIETNNNPHGCCWVQIAMDVKANAIAVWWNNGNIWSKPYTAASGWGTATLIQTATGSGS